MREIQLFNFNGKQVRTVLVNDEPYFVGKDVAEILGYANTRDALAKHVDEEDKKDALIQGSRGGKQTMKVINESGLFNLTMSSKLPTAKEFKRWVASKALPSISKHVAYMVPKNVEDALLSPDTIIKLAQQIKQERERRMIAEQRVNELTPKATYYDQVLASKSLVTIKQIAKDYGMSETAMNSKLNEMKVIYRQGSTWLLYAKYQKLGWTLSETFLVDNTDGTKKAVMHTKWTQKGRLGLYAMLKKLNVLPLIEQDNLEEN